MHFITTCLAAAAVFTGSVALAQESTSARANFVNSEGAHVGSATLRETSAGVLVHVTLFDIPSGAHAFHIHTTGRCDAPGFATAGGHFAPGGSRHGFLNHAEPHAGDLPNVHVGGDGTASFELLASEVTLGAGAHSLLDADGAALVLHAEPDDYMTDPAGNAGGRIACAVVTANVP
jgi:superoxide dismutase, Cu-Zn family